MYIVKKATTLCIMMKCNTITVSSTWLPFHGHPAVRIALAICCGIEEHSQDWRQHKWPWWCTSGSQANSHAMFNSLCTPLVFSFACPATTPVPHCWPLIYFVSFLRQVQTRKSCTHTMVILTWIVVLGSVLEVRSVLPVIALPCAVPLIPDSAA